ncbi:hypothetical protein [Variovorax sp. J31P207]|uniref:hypothetical protein n=1 Tax=Variovorax sp. J31P207 TaxID=3053510 RepID=UPI002576BE8D|nr:hypothetical protein [Variovorax sp. J31P207]MDM0071857.1 hypothetical protein [Variovorax sp. J31P207]
MVQFSDESLNGVAPGLAYFTAAVIPDIQTEFDQSKHWMTNHFLNTLFGPKFKPGHRPHFVTFLMRAQACFRDYGRAREATAKFLTGLKPGSPSIAGYFEAVNAWESVVLNWAMAVESYNTISKPDKAFNPNDGSVEERAYGLHNHIKHWSKKGVSVSHLPDDTVPMWLTNDGPASRTYSLTFEEVATLLRDLGKVANEFQHPGGGNGSP